MRKIVISALGFLALAGLIGFLATSGGGFSHGAIGGGGASPSPAAGHREATLGIFAPGDDQALTAQSAVGAGGAPAADIGNLPPIGPDIVKTARISVEVKKGGFQSAFDEATAIAGKYGGYVQDSSMAGTKSKSGSLTIRVPSSSFDQAMSDLRGLGTVQSQSVSGQDVTAQFVDLDARLRTWEAQEAVLLRLMRQATSVEATLRVQNQLQDVQFRIEQIKGQLRVLENQTSLATIQVAIRETGAPIKVQQAVAKRPSLAEAWDRALAGFLGVIYAIVVGLGYLVPVTLIALALLLGYRRLRPRAATS
jgi:hypothetical protein